MPEASGRMANLRKTLTVVAVTATTVGWVVGADPPRATALGVMGIGAVGIVYFTLRPYRPRHSHSSLPLPLFPVLVVA